MGLWVLSVCWIVCWSPTESKLSREGHRRSTCLEGLRRSLEGQKTMCIPWDPNFENFFKLRKFAIRSGRLKESEMGETLLLYTLNFFFFFFILSLDWSRATSSCSASIPHSSSLQDGRPISIWLHFRYRNYVRYARRFQQRSQRRELTRTVYTSLSLFRSLT